MSVFQSSRRRLLQGAAGLGVCALTSRIWANTPQEVRVMTSYPEPVMSLFEAAFERAFPQYRLNIIWRRPQDALEHLSQLDQGSVDLYWAASPRTFERLRQLKAWQPIDVSSIPVTRALGHLPLVAEDNSYLATELAGYGFAFDPATLNELGVQPPKDWQDLLTSKLAERIALPVPSQVGFAAVLADIPLQAYGWEQGWVFWSELAGLSYLIQRGSTFITDEVVAKRAAIGLSIDFFVTGAIAGGAPLKFAYPEHGGLNPAHVAITRSAPNRDGAQAFVAFLLSNVGQQLLEHPDVHKLPVRPEVYAQLPADYFNPFQAAARTGWSYNPTQGQSRLGLVTALFEQMLVQPHSELKQLWALVHQQESQQGKRLHAVRALLCQPLIPEAALEPALLSQFQRLEGSQPPTANPLEGQWASQMQQRLQQARQHLEAKA